MRKDGVGQRGGGRTDGQAEGQGAGGRRKEEAGWEEEEGEGPAQGRGWPCCPCLAYSCSSSTQPAGSLCGRTLSWIMEEPRMGIPWVPFKFTVGTAEDCGGVLGTVGGVTISRGPWRKVCVQVASTPHQPLPAGLLKLLPTLCIFTPEAKPPEKAPRLSLGLHT